MSARECPFFSLRRRRVLRCRGLGVAGTPGVWLPGVLPSLRRVADGYGQTFSSSHLSAPQPPPTPQPPQPPKAVCTQGCPCFLWRLADGRQQATLRGRSCDATEAATAPLVVATRATECRCGTGGSHPPQRSEEWVA